MGQVGSYAQFRAPGSAAVSITRGRIVEVGDDYEFAASGPAAAILVLDGDDLVAAGSGTEAAQLLAVGKNIILMEV